MTSPADPNEDPGTPPIAKPTEAELGIERTKGKPLSPSADEAPPPGPPPPPPPPPPPRGVPEN